MSNCVLVHCRRRVQALVRATRRRLPLHLIIAATAHPSSDTIGLAGSRPGTDARTAGPYRTDSASLTAAISARVAAAAALEHDPEKWVPVFGKDHAPAKS